MTSVQGHASQSVSSLEDAPAQDLIAVADGVGSSLSFRALYVGGAGNVALIPLHHATDDYVVVPNVPDASLLPFAGRALGAVGNGTTATGVVLCI